MAIFVRDPATHTWKQANNPTSRLIYLHDQGVWKAAANIWLEGGGLWTKTDYVGVPNAPTNLIVTSSSTNFTNFSFAWTAPVGGAPVDHYHFIFYFQDGSFWTDATYPVGTTTITNWPVAPDTYYQMEVTAVSAAGVESAPSNRVRYFVGHPQQTRSDPVYGWGTPFAVTTAYSYVSTIHAPNDGSLAVDGNFGTYWASGARGATGNFEGIRVYGPSSYRRVYSVKVTPQINNRIWLGMAQDGTWYGGQTGPANAGLWFGSGPASVFATHNYLMVTPIWPGGTLFEFVIDNAYAFTLDRCTIDVAVDQLSSFLGGLRASLQEVSLMVQDWVIVSYNTVVTVNQLNNAYW